MYIRSIKIFGQALREPTISPSIILDLSDKNLGRKLVRRDLGEILKRNKNPLELTIDFGENRLSDKFMASLVEGLSSGNGSAGVTLCFGGNINLSAKGIQGLISGLVSQQFQPALTLHISGVNLEGKKTFNLFVDAITSPECLPWLTVEFHVPGPGCPRMSPESVTYLINALERKTHALGLSIDIGKNGTDEQQRIVHRHCEQTARVGFEYLKTTTQYNEETHTLLLKEIKATVNRETEENKKWVRLALQNHIQMLRTCTISKDKRIRALKRLDGIFSINSFLKNTFGLEKIPSTIYEIICDWECFVAETVYTEAQLISSLKEAFSSFRSNTCTSTQELIAQLKLQYADAPLEASLKIDASSCTTSALSIMTEDPNSHHSTPT